MKKLDLTLVSMFILTLTVALISTYLFLKNTCTSLPYNYSCFSFWENVRCGNIGGSFMLTMPTIIVIGCCHRFFQKIKTGYFKNSLNRVDYTKYIRKEILKTYLKSFLIVPLVSLIIFLLGLLFYGTNIPLTNGVQMQEYISFFDYSNNLFLFVIGYSFLTCLFSFLSINIGLILGRFINKFYLLILAVYVTFTAINFILVFNVFGKIAEFFIKDNLKNQLNLYALYNPSLSIQSLPLNIIMYLLLLLISTIIVYVLYKNKEKLVLENA
ncbi:MAG: hypothetical protein RR922_05035 [Clostridia bacterium]